MKSYLLQQIKLDDSKEKIIDYTNIKKNFYYPLTIGASLNKDFNMWRYFNGTLSNIKVEFTE